DNGLQVSDLVAIKDRASLAFDPTNASRLALIKAEASTKLKKQVYTALTTGNYMNYHLTVSKPDSAFDGLQVPSSLVTWVSSDPTVASFGTGSNAGKLTANKKGSTTVSAVVKGYTLQSFTVTVATTNNGGGGGGGDVITPTPAPTPSIPVPNGSTIVTPQTTTTVETDANGNKINVVKVDESALLGQLTQGSDSKAVVISADTNGGTAKVELSLDLLTKAAANNSGNTFIILINGAAYELPASLVSSDSIAKALNLSAADAAGATISIVTSEQPQSVTSQVEAATGGHSVAKVIDFSIVVTKGDQSATLNNFGSTYVNRAFDLTGTVDGKQAVGVVINSDGTVAPVPTEFVQVGDKKVAVLKRNGNSTYTVLTHDVQFADIDKSWAKADIKLLADKMIITGYSDGNFHPTENVTRGQFATLLARGLGLSKSTNAVKFTDVANNAFYAGYVQALADAGIVNGYSDGTYKGGDNISRQDTIILLSKAVEFLKLRGDLSDADAAQAIQKFKDIDKVGGYAKTAVGITTGLHLISGDDQGHLNPTNNTSRAETVIMIEKLLNLAKFL
ncbi:MAG: S-layer homology domain-containing protein, partial [Tumebacillaceae bacterium]